MENNEEFFDERLLVKLTIAGTNVEEELVEITDPNRTVHDTIVKMMESYQLPKMDPDGNIRIYQLARMNEETGEKQILEQENENGEEMSLIEYNIDRDDHLYLMYTPLAG